MSNLVKILKDDSTVKRYIELRNIILANKELSTIIMSDLSLNKAKIDNFEYENIIDEYSELEKMVKNDLEMISTIINGEININFLT